MRSFINAFLKAQAVFLISMFFFSCVWAQESRSSSSILLPRDKEIQKYCSNIVNVARDQRYLLQKKALEELKQDVDNRIAILEKRKAEYEHWFNRFEDFMTIYDKNIVDIYKKMTAAAAAAQLEKVNPKIASSILMKLTSRQASLVMAEMDPQKAAIITTIISNILGSKSSEGSS